MQANDFVKKHILEHLIGLGLEHHTAIACADKGVEFYNRQVANARDPFKEACDYAGNIAMQRNAKFKYKSPTSKRQARQKRPQEAFKF
ncbi:membrane lipoprotein [Vibrio phage vB_VpaM_XM1]|uniref:Membrane lipoprotein n=1 Tax=Vibrio phage PVP-XSN TaxID=3056214 RepID=A0AAX3Y6R7_9CAUD|nr:membrane lipoprotein [Vibrio phage PVP-XSN]